jgi:predicted RNA-binding Zn ribbon-like protein
MRVSLTAYARAAALATDLVNTAPRVRAAGDALTDPQELARFLEEHEIRLAAWDGEPSAGDLKRVRVLRDEIRAILEAPSGEDVAEAANAMLSRAGARPVLDRDDGDGRGGGWSWYAEAPPGSSLADVLAVLAGAGLLGALQALGHDRFRHCGSPDCDGMFVDISRAGRRRYCMPDLCGNRVNVANHRARRRQ